jgi:DNA-binding transcriptional LysR family regulator
MFRVQLNELAAFVAVAEHKSFTKAAAQVGIALPTMSQTIRTLEDRLGVRLFNRTTRSVALTEAGDRLLAEVQPILEGVDHAIESVNAFRDKPMGTLRLAIERSASQIMLARAYVPLMQPFLAEYPSIRVEIAVDDGSVDIVSGRFDAGIRLGHRIERDMTIFRIEDDLQLLTVTSPNYMNSRSRPLSPNDLHKHNCVRFRRWDGALSPWSYSKSDQEIEVAVDGSLVVNDVNILLNFLLDGSGIGRLPAPMVESYLAEGRLISILDDWTPTLPGIFLYHSSRRQTPAPLQAYIKFVEQWRKSRRGK